MVRTSPACGVSSGRVGDQEKVDAGGLQHVFDAVGRGAQTDRHYWPPAATIAWIATMSSTDRGMHSATAESGPTVRDELAGKRVDACPELRVGDISPLEPQRGSVRGRRNLRRYGVNDRTVGESRPRHPTRGPRPRRGRRHRAGRWRPPAVRGSRRDGAHDLSQRMGEHGDLVVAERLRQVLEADEGPSPSGAVTMFSG